MKKARTNSLLVNLGAETLPQSMHDQVSLRCIARSRRHSRASLEQRGVRRRDFCDSLTSGSDIEQHFRCAILPNGPFRLYVGIEFVVWV